MATVISLSENKIKELLAGYEGVSMNQEQINALVQEMYIAQQTINARMDFLDGTTMPQLIQDVASGAIRIDELTATVIPSLDAAQAQNAADLENLTTVTLPTLEQDLASTAATVRESPQTYHQAEAPLNPDDELRDLVVGDTWYDSDDNNKRYTWNGVEWTQLEGSGSTTIPDFSLTVRKFLSSTHQIY
jgi:hypothetical protein